MLISINETTGGRVRVSIHNEGAGATVTLPTEKALESFAALVQGRNATLPISLLNDEARAVWISMEECGYATVPLTGAWQDDCAKALARLACILTDTTTEGE